MRRGSAECVGRKRLLRRAARVVIRTRHPAGDSGTGDVPHWSSAGRAEDRQGFPFGGIPETPAPARLPGGHPGSLVARLVALPLIN
ncbi:hypothetical protein NDU88_009129 [Pleurodeles waltl]|uniref:Uncharacterized protein n=1 Tax=Pleurodeles waltl TaxID=8319 RepID=A0AAV7RZM3_PLEWA|nr:hypothetical protein NDU88_009129 [Pleurodeles waltl]